MIVDAKRSGMDELFRVTDRWGRVIILTRDRWSAHILVRHPEFRGQPPSILADALITPSFVNVDRFSMNREVFYRPSPLVAPLDHLLIRVVVELGAVGQVVTAHLIKEPHRKEQRLWP
jgi:hypothetical protein